MNRFYLVANLSVNFQFFFRLSSMKTDYICCRYSTQVQVNPGSAPVLLCMRVSLLCICAYAYSFMTFECGDFWCILQRFRHFFMLVRVRRWLSWRMRKYPTLMLIFICRTRLPLAEWRKSLAPSMNPWVLYLLFLDDFVHLCGMHAIYSV